MFGCLTLATLAIAVLAPVTSPSAMVPLEASNPGRATLAAHVPRDGWPNRYLPS
jgi:hypothetical protein